MRVCYIDEAGCTGELPTAASPIQPVFILTGLILAREHIRPLTVEWMSLKQRFHPNMLPAGSLFNDWMAAEIKGADLRKRARSTDRNDRRSAHGFLEKTLELVERYGGRLTGKVFVKPIGGAFRGTSIYTATVQTMCATFQHCLDHHGSHGILIADSRNKGKNANLSHSIFTQRHQAGGDPFDRLVEVPTFGHSENHAGLQIADILSSALLFPIATQVCSDQHLTDKTHCHPRYIEFRDRYGLTLKRIQYRYQDQTGRWRGGMSLSDPLNHWGAPVLFAGGLAAASPSTVPSASTASS